MRTRRSTREWVAAALSALIALTASGCSGPGPSPSSTTARSLQAVIQAAPDGRAVPLPAGRYLLRGFQADVLGADLRRRSLAGAGIGRTVIELEPHSSASAQRVPTAPYSTNPLYLLSTMGGSPQLSGFTLRGTPQGHLYNGLRIGEAVAARVHDVRIEAVPGDRSYPPGETFALNDWRTEGSVYSRLTIDGEHLSAADFGTNSSENVTVNDSTFTGSGYSAGATFWQTTNVTLNDVRIIGNRSGINVERSGGAITLNRPTFRRNGSFDLQFGTDLAGGVVTINDPVLAPGQKLRLHVPARYHGAPNGQQRADIHVLVHGVDRTAALLQYL